ncbi:hypothetical protein LG198_01120 [Methylobacillus arboreus]|uniref:hypothetical protein n=1 Tax=Methylobacillus arboreus TaxID=755170 RepID=UPI001E29DCE8|nr:hypothetical protein [Methylobacillus arboreus]MCB5189329.1 hypothetical protein [Methylobacillus arboreus]
MKLTPGQWLVWSALLATLAATAWTSFTDTDIDAVQAAARQPDTPRQAASMPKPGAPATEVEIAGTGSLDLAQLKRTPWQDSENNLFSGTRAASLAMAEAPVVQQAMEIPPVPFTYAGTLEDQGQYIVFLSMGDKNVSVKTGDVIGDWKIKEIKPPRMTLSYQPLRADVPLMMGESN